MTMGYDPFQGTAVGYNPQSASNLYNYASLASQNAYQSSMQQYQQDQLAFQQAQAAYTDAMSMGSAYGYMPGGNLFSWPIGGQPSFTMPTAGTPTMQAVAQGQTLSNQQLQNQLAMSQVTGQFAQPMPSQYSPGTVLTAPSTTPGLGPAYGVVNSDGSVSIMTGQALQQYAGQRGITAQAMMQNAQPVDWNTLQQLSMGPPTGSNMPTMAAQQQQFAQAQQAAGLTGMFTDPTQALAAYNARGQSLNGQTFGSLPQDQQQYWLQWNQNDPTRAAQQWAAAVNGAQAQAIQAAGGQVGGPQETLAAQQQYAAQANQLAQLYGQYYAPTAPGQTAQAGVNAPAQGQQTLAGQQQAFAQNLQTQQFQQQAAQSYLGLLSQLQGPADYGRYLNVLGSTPSGIQGLVGAAAGNYIPGGGVTGQAPQAQTLQNLVGAATGYAANAGAANPYAASFGGSGQNLLGPAPNYATLPTAGLPQNLRSVTGANQAFDPSQMQMQGIPSNQTYQNLMGAASGQAGTGTGTNAATTTPTQGGTASPGGMNYQDYLATAQGLPPPSQIAPQSFKAMMPSQQQMLGGLYSSLGYAPGDINAMYQASLPKYAAGSAAGNFKLV